MLADRTIEADTSLRVGANVLLMITDDVAMFGHRLLA
jgi:hypothetical protein